MPQAQPVASRRKSEPILLAESGQNQLYFYEREAIADTDARTVAKGDVSVAVAFCNLLRAETLRIVLLGTAPEVGVTMDCILAPEQQRTS